MNSKDEIALFELIEAQKLVPSLIKQLNKDIDLSGVDFHFKESIQLNDLVIQVYDFLFKLMSLDFGNYLNFLYRVDIPEKRLNEITEIDPKLIAEKVTILVLKREWQKVSFRNKIQ